MGLFDKAKDLAAKHNDKLDQAIDKAGDLIDSKTGDKYADKVDQGQDFIKDKLDDAATKENPPTPAS